jgi:hypothetical protein
VLVKRPNSINQNNQTKQPNLFGGNIMIILLKVGAAMALLAALMTSGFYAYLTAEGKDTLASTVTAADRMIKDETRSITAAITQIEVSGPVKLMLRQSATPSLIVRSEQRHISKISTDQSDPEASFNAASPDITALNAHIAICRIPLCKHLRQR